MRHNAAILLALGAPAVALLNEPAPRSVVQESWSAPARETIAADEENDQQLALGWSPRPTQAPKPLMGRMLVPRLDGYTLGPQTCGFVPTNANSFTCISSGATCTPQGGYVGCCQPNSQCSAIKTTCIDYAASSAGACDLPSDYHTLCCGTSTIPACYTWVISTSALTDKSASLYTLFDCSPAAGRGTLLTYDPAWSKTHIFSSTPTTTSAPTTDSTPPATTGGSDNNGNSTNTGGGGGGGGGGTNVGAIAGGAVGGVAAIALIGTAAFFLFRRKPQPVDPAPPAQPPAMTQQQPPPQSPTSPGGAVYPSGVPPGYPGGFVPSVSPQQPYDPRLSGYGQYPQEYQQQYQQYPQQFQGQYPAQQQYGYPVPTGSTSPPPHNSPSPGVFKEGETPSPPPQQQQQQQQAPTELAAVNPLGAETNRAELAS